LPSKTIVNNRNALKKNIHDYQAEILNKRYKNVQIMIKQTSVIIVVIGYDDDYNTARGTTRARMKRPQEKLRV
jgi:hypothetical protein